MRVVHVPHLEPRPLPRQTGVTRPSDADFWGRVTNSRAMPMEGLPTGTVSDVGRPGDDTDDGDDGSGTERQEGHDGQDRRDAAPPDHHSGDPAARDGPRASDHPHPATAKRIARLERENDRLRTLVDRKDDQLARVIDYYEDLLEQRREASARFPFGSFGSFGPLAALRRLLR